MSLPYICRDCGQKFERLAAYETHSCPRWHGYPWEEPESEREMNWILALVCAICLLGIIITLEVVAINDERRADEARIELFELRRAEELRNMAVERCIKAAELRGLDFVQVCPDWVYRND